MEKIYNIQEQMGSITREKETGKEQFKPKASRRKGIIKIRIENEIENREIEKIHKTQSCFFEMISKINKPLARLTN